MSLILEALRKLERDKGTPDRGFVVMTANAWPAEGTRRYAIVAMAVVAGAALSGLAIWAATRTSGPAARLSSDAPTTSSAAVVPTTMARRPGPPVVAAPRPAAAPATEAPAPPEVVIPDPAPASTPAAPSTGRGELRLQAISQRDGKPIALLNDRIVREGEAFDGVRIVAIRDAEVEVEVNGRRTVLKF